MKRIFILAAFITAAFSQAVRAQNLTATQVQNLMNTKDYMFEAQTVTPERGGIKQLTPGYSLKVSGDSLVAYLPYFGRAYSAPLNPADAGIQFTSTNFDYKVAERTKGGYDVSIRSKDKTYNADFALTVYDNGSAYLQVTSTDKQLISFNGYIKAEKE